MYCSVCQALLRENTSENRLVYECPRGHDVNVEIDPKNTLIFTINRKLPEFTGSSLNNVMYDRSHSFIESPCGKCGAKYRKFNRDSQYKPRYICVCGFIE
jgi:phage FluMu protein Com